ASMVRRRRGSGDIGADDVEPVDLEPVDLDLEPIDLEPVGSVGVWAERLPARRRDDRRRVALLTAAVAAAAALAFVTVNRSAHHTRRAAPRPAPVPTTGTPAFESTDSVAALARRLQPYWPDGEAIVMYGRLYVARARDPRPAIVVPQRKAAVIEDQSGSS